MPFLMPEITVPVFPDRVCSIADYGAVSGGEIMNTKSFAEAISDCAQNGGGKVLVPDGEWLTGPIHLKSNVNLHLEDNAKIVFSSNPNDYLPVVFTRYEGTELYNYSPFVYANGCENIAITGKGKLDGQGKNWWHWKMKEKESSNRLYDMALAGVPVEERIFGTEEYLLRPSFIQIVNSKNILLEDFSIKNGPMWTIHPVYSENITIRGINVDIEYKNIKINGEKSPNGYNNDGIVIDSSKNVLVENCVLNTSDDAIVIKSGKDADGLRVNRPSKNIVIRNCKVIEGHGAITIGSEMSGGVKNVFAYNCEISGVSVGIRIKSAKGRGGFVENVWVKNISMEKISGNAINIDANYSATVVKPKTEYLPILQNIYFENISGKSIRGSAVFLKGIDGEDVVRNIVLENMKLYSGKGLRAIKINGLQLKNIKIYPKEGLVIDATGSENVSIQ